MLPVGSPAVQAGCLGSDVTDRTPPQGITGFFELKFAIFSRNPPKAASYQAAPLKRYVRLWAAASLVSAPSLTALASGHLRSTDYRPPAVRDREVARKSDALNNDRSLLDPADETKALQTSPSIHERPTRPRI